jgi:uncharacterized iron-regulated membrane protein
MRTFLLAVHRYLGLASAVFLTLAGLTGSLLVFDGALDAALNPDLFQVAVRTPVLAGPELAARVAAANPAIEIAVLPVRIEPGRAVKMALASGDQIFVDPADGRIVGTRDEGPGWDRRHLVQGIFRLHYTLLAGHAGRWLMGGIAVGWLVANGVGFYLTLPARAPFWSKWRPMWLIKSTRNPLRLLLDLHRASGLWLLIGVLILSFTSAALNFYDELYRPAVAALSPPAETPWDRPLPPPRDEPAPIGFDAALQRATALATQDGITLVPATLHHFADRQLYGVGFTPTGADEYRGLGPVSYLLDDRTGSLVFVDNPWTDSTGQKMLRALYPLHSGQVGGLATRLFVCLLGLATVEMAVTGIIVWWKKRKARVLRRRSAAEPA